VKAAPTIGARRDLQLAVAGTEIHCEVVGDGRPVVFFHHSFGNAGWLPVHDALAADFALHVPDLPGFGRSQRPDWARDPRDIAILMASWIRKLDVGPVAVVGCGFGGWIAAEMATMQPQVLSHLVLVGSAGLLPEQGRILDQILISHSEYVQAAFKHRSAYEAVYSAELTDDLLIAWDINREMITRVAWKPHMYNRRLRPLLAEVAIPTLLVWGDDDRVVPRECAHQFADALPDARLEIVEDCGHAVDMERGESLARLVRRHVLGND
jgi:pimeloyl-ACP methyl ester carboxylesterase